MKIIKPSIFIILFFLLQISSVFAQDKDENINISEKIKKDILKEYNKWAIKGTYENRAEYDARIKSQSEAKLKELSTKYFESYKKCALPSPGRCYNKGTYDSENETFPITVNLESPWGYKYNLNLIIKIPRQAAKSLGNFIIDIIPYELSLVNDKWTINKAFIFIQPYNYENDFVFDKKLEFNENLILKRTGSNYEYSYEKIFKDDRYYINTVRFVEKIKSNYRNCYEPHLFHANFTDKDLVKSYRKGYKKCKTPKEKEEFLKLLRDSIYRSENLNYNKKIVKYTRCLSEVWYKFSVSKVREFKKYCPNVAFYEIYEEYSFDISYSTDFRNDYVSDNEIYIRELNFSEQPDYNPSNIQSVSINLDDFSISFPTQTTISNQASTQLPDLNMNSIQSKNTNPDAFAVVIGNKDYQSTKNVSYAINDAQTIKKYLINILGYKEGNIFYMEDASKSNFETFFGTKENPQGKLYNNIKHGTSDVFVYYSGHGAPGLKDKKGYFVPIDCDPQYVEQGGYSLDLFYNNISKLNAKSITVVTDACFSGAEIFDNISPVTITVSNPIAVADNCVVLSSSSGSQVSSWLKDKQHGMFTYFFLRALQDKNKSDKNNDGKLSFEEIFNYVSDKTEGVPYYARSINGIEQTPTIQGKGENNIFIEYK